MLIGKALSYVYKTGCTVQSAKCRNHYTASWKNSWTLSVHGYRVNLEESRIKQNFFWGDSYVELSPKLNSVSDGEGRLTWNWHVPNLLHNIEKFPSLDMLFSKILITNGKNIFVSRPYELKWSFQKINLLNIGRRDFT